MRIEVGFFVELGVIYNELQSNVHKIGGATVVQI